LRWLLLKLLLHLLLLFLRHVMTHGTAGRRTQHRMVTGHVPGYGANRGSFDATLGCGRLRSGEQGDSKHGHRKSLHRISCFRRHGTLRKSAAYRLNAAPEHPQGQGFAPIIRRR
jgi:hypothetical protein